ncbi:hypothetical protein Goshw_022954 [Gossypium schwendimanii]|uniref:Uncharacterized protein n=2 Tax=Gossypium TaxID=3633 RepID=A0A7J9LBJ5_GOSSC|nr:hypothetical protein [Gossypium laxum]MBA0856074.1 hypothetical protein [Gossypium schwendimanii]
MVPRFVKWMIDDEFGDLAL